MDSRSDSGLRRATELCKVSVEVWAGSYGAFDPAYATAAIISSSDRLAVTVCIGALVGPLRDFVRNPISCRRR